MTEVTLKEDEALCCPFCGEQPTIQPWHGGGPSKRLVSCGTEHCVVSPSVTGNTRSQALEAWNRRRVPTGWDRERYGRFNKS